MADAVPIIVDQTTGSQRPLAASDTIVKSNGSGIQVKLATTDPTVTDDVTLGYIPGNDWINTINQETFKCISNAVGAAKWTPTGGPTHTDILPTAQARVGANSTRIAQTTYDGASYNLLDRISFNRFIFRITGLTGTPSLNILIYQAEGGVGSNTTNLIATCQINPVGIGNQIVTPNEGTVHLEQGVFFVLMGRSSVSDSATFRTFAVNTNDLLNDNVDTDTYPVAFTTNIAASTTPSTFNPLMSGGSVTATVSDVALICRMKTV